jgi:hypothetical protein
MGSRLRTGTGWLLVFLFVFSGFGCLSLHQARQFSNATPSERSTSTESVYRQYELFYGLRFNYFNCNFVFTVDGAAYSGHADCPSPIAPGRAATVYYDPSDPSLNSLMEFRAANRNSIRDAILDFDFASIFLLGCIFVVALAIIKKTAKGRIMVDVHGTVIYPEQAGSRVLPGAGATSTKFDSSPTREIARNPDSNAPPTE